MKKTMKKWVAVAMSAAMAVSLAGCGGGGQTSAPKEAGAGSGQESGQKADDGGKGEAAGTDAGTAAGEKVTLNVWHQWSNDTTELKAIYDQAVADYQKENPNVTIHTETLDTEAYKTKISAEFAGNASGIDVFYYWGAGMARKLVNADKLLPLDSYVTQEVKDKLMDGSTAAFTYDGKLYSLPSFSWYMTLFCNKTLFDQAGAQLPDTYDQLLDACQKLASLDGITPIAAGAKDGWNAAFVYQALALREAGAAEVNQMLSGQAEFGGQAYVDAANKLTELYNAGAFGKNPLESGNDDANSAFISGKAAMRLMGSWFVNQVYTDETATVNPEDVVACKIPMVEGKGDPSDYCGGFVESFWVNKNTKYADEAAKFCAYINEKMGVAAYETGSGFSGWKVDMDESKLNPLFIQVKDLLAEGKNGVLAWDTSLDAEPATVHNEQVQTLFAPNADIGSFIEMQQEVINK